ncbi:MAG: type II secretion system protein [Gammaproteobacteria bacterium]|nr:type II secretion system protein [Gammaproteobacteria bacterium]
MRRRGGDRGATLIELIAAIVVVSIATVGVLLALSGAVGHSADPMVEQQAIAVAEAYLEEVTQAAFCDPDFLAPGQTCRAQCTVNACGTCGGGALREAERSLYDDVCDYDGIADGGARDRNGNPIAGLAAYAVTVAVDDDASLGNPAISGAAGAVVRIDVAVTHPGLNDPVVLSAFRANAR